MSARKNTARTQGLHLGSIIPDVAIYTIVPILTNALFVNLGKQIAKGLHRAFGLPVEDLMVGLLMLSFGVSVWGSYQLVERDRENDKIDGVARLVSCANLLFGPVYGILKIWDGEGRLDWLVYAALWVAIFIVTPFTLTLDPIGRSQEGEPKKRALQQFVLLISRNAMYGVAAGLLVAVGCNAWFVLLNDDIIPVIGPRIGGSILEAGLGVDHGQRYWMLNPGVALPILVLQVCAFEYGTTFTPPPGFKVRRSSVLRWGVFAMMCVVNLVGAVVVIGTESIFYDDLTKKETLGFPIWVLKMGIGAVYMAAFIGAFYLSRSRSVRGRRDDGTSQRWMVRPAGWSIVRFGLAGVLAGASMWLLRVALDQSLSTHVHLVWMHGVSFAVGAIAFIVAVRFMEGRLVGARALL